jgi:hypothetical protein
MNTLVKQNSLKVAIERLERRITELCNKYRQCAPEEEPNIRYLTAEYVGLKIALQCQLLEGDK